MNYDEAIKLARNWTTDQGPEDWRNVMTVLLQRITVLETTNKNLHSHISRLAKENSCLSLDLGIKDQAFRLTESPK